MKLSHKQMLQLHLRNTLMCREMSYQDLADVVGMSRQSVHQSLNSESVSLDKLISITEAWGFIVTIEIS